MKLYDFTQEGGFPFTQNILARMQTAYRETINALAAAFGDGSDTVPIVLTGMKSSDAGGGDTAVSAGWFLYNGEVIYFPGDSYAAPLPDFENYVVITTSATPLTFNDASTPNVVIESAGSIEVLADTTPEDETKFLVSSLKTAAVAFAEANIDDLYGEWQTPVYENDYIAHASSPIAYRRAVGSKVVRIKGKTLNSLGHSTVSDEVVFTLPEGYRPSEEQVFSNISENPGGQHVPIRVKPNGEVSLAGDIIGVPSDENNVVVAFEVD